MIGLGARIETVMGGASNTYMTSSWPHMTHKERDFTV